ncbi:MAG: hypothetical protein DMF62_11240 [Acidobacteria bacterium]|nr:MAG: hypothetical protein DMF62_11240 [Acidobacteriota bacterium]
MCSPWVYPRYFMRRSTSVENPHLQSRIATRWNEFVVDRFRGLKAMATISESLRDENPFDIGMR